MTIDARFSIQRDSFTLNVELAIPDSGITAIFGSSGSGKTTLLRVIAGLEHARDGYLKVGDEIWQGPGKFLLPHQRPLGYVFQEPSLFPHLNIQSNLEYGLKRLKGRQQKISLDHAIDLLGIGSLLKRRTHQLSGGEQQRVAIARALAVSPKLLLLDEPLSGLDEPRKQEILPYLESLHQDLDIPMLYVSHSRNEVARLADHMIIMNNGHVQASGRVEDLFTRLDLPQAHEPDTGTVIDATVAGHDKEFSLTFLDFPGGRFTVAHKPLEIGTSARIQVLARDVSITLMRQEKTSILNIFPAEVDEIIDEGSAQVTIRLMLQNVPVLCRITRKSANELSLKPGSSVFVQVKSVALLT